MHAMRARKPDVLAELAGRQYGIVSRSQLTALGLDRGWVQRSVAEGQLLRLHRGVYAVGHRAPRREARWLAAVLACGPDAVLSHRSAAELWRIGGASGVPEVTLPRRIRPRGIVAHEAALAAADKALNGNIPLTSPARTVVDLAHVLAERDVERLVREAYFRKLVSAATLRDALTRRPSRLIRELLDDLNPTQSRLEDAFLRLCRRFRIPAPEAQLRAGRRRPDF
ncbi:MAG: hypothetical protein QOG77_1555, partial [Solirubrobacteraceae bacterium]|nr:hypothetical protein [Solirubrobacteraceae bacterium]